MKVLFTAADINQMGGIEKYNRDFLGALRNAGKEVRLIELKGVKLLQKMRFVLIVCLRAVLTRPDIIICAHISFSPICYFLKKLFGINYAVTLYGIEAINIKSKLQLRAVALAGVVIAISEYTKRNILVQLPAIEEKIFILSSAVDGEKFFIKEKMSSLVSRYDLENKKIILTIARLSSSDEKGQDRVIKALPFVLKEVPSAVYLIVGGGRDIRVDELLNNKPVAKNVILTGPIKEEELVDYYNLADVFVMPSKFEGFAIVFIEAMACGLPVIASDNYGCREALRGGTLGLLVNPDKPEDIAKMIIKVLNKSRDIPQGILNKEWVRASAFQIYGIDKFYEGVKRIFDKLVLLKEWAT